MHITAIRELADHLVALSDEQGLTPVLATDGSVTLRPAFYMTLLQQLPVAAGRHVRLELLINSARLNWISRYRVARLNKILSTFIRESSTGALSLERRLTLSRPAGILRPLTVGLTLSPCELPAWATLVELSYRPSRLSQVQVVAA